MKDLKFTGGALTSPAIFRVDSISGHGNVTVLEIYGLNDRQPQVIDTQIERDLISRFKKIKYTIDEFIAFAASKNLVLQISNSDGTDSKLLSGIALVVTTPVAASSSADTTPTFSGTGTVGAAISIVIDNLTFTTVVSSVGTWTKDATVLATGAKSAVITATKDGLSISVTRAFTITA